MAITAQKASDMVQMSALELSFHIKRRVIHCDVITVINIMRTMKPYANHMEGANGMVTTFRIVRAGGCVSMAKYLHLCINIVNIDLWKFWHFLCFKKLMPYLKFEVGWRYVKNK